VCKLLVKSTFKKENNLNYNSFNQATTRQVKVLRTQLYYLISLIYFPEPNKNKIVANNTGLLTEQSLTFVTFLKTIAKQRKTILVYTLNQFINSSLWIGVTLWLRA